MACGLIRLRLLRHVTLKKVPVSKLVALIAKRLPPTKPACLIRQSLTSAIPITRQLHRGQRRSRRQTEARFGPRRLPRKSVPIQAIPAIRFRIVIRPGAMFRYLVGVKAAEIAVWNAYLFLRLRLTFALLKTQEVAWQQTNWRVATIRTGPVAMTQNAHQFQLATLLSARLLSHCAGTQLRVWNLKIIKFHVTGIIWVFGKLCSPEFT